MHLLNRSPSPLGAVWRLQHNGDPRGLTPEGAQLGGSKRGLDLTVTVSVGRRGHGPEISRRRADCQLAGLAEEGRGVCGSWGPWCWGPVAVSAQVQGKPGTTGSHHAREKEAHHHPPSAWSIIKAPFHFYELLYLTAH